MRCCIPLAFCAAVIASAQPIHKHEKNWRQVCEQATAQPVQAPALTGPLSAKELAGCDETALYYGIGRDPDYAAALQCGWYQRAHPQHRIGNMFYGPGVLAMLYANGKGVPRDYGLAMRFACEDEWAAEAEDELRIGHLQQLRASGNAAAKFDLCDDITSGLSDGFCTSIQTRMGDVARAREIAALVKRLSPVAKSAFESLQAAETAFEKARVENEVDLTGTSRGAFVLQEQAELRDQFFNNLRQCATGGIPAASGAELGSLDRELNEVYRRILNAPAEKWEFGTVKPEGIRATERRWVALTEAWSSFAQAASPSLPVTGVRAHLVRLRLKQLQALAGN